ncbi:hypothetical protein AX17_005775 [Amanita inopinata Kibby_2008]|nr:hypothetical protein AX17_005775 [Amanita inopinata Kibby_2008]
MTTAWSQTSHVRHPWFDNFGTKRKFCSGTPMTTDNVSCMEDSGSIEVALASNQRPTKRRRCSTLECGIAHLSLTTSPAIDCNQPTSAVYGACHTSVTSDIMEDLAMATDLDMSAFMSIASISTIDYEANAHTRPGFVEELAPNISDINMSKSTWYEPEPDRIVITELDTSSDEETDVSDPQKTKSLYVSAPLLDHIRSRTIASSFTPSIAREAPSTSQALVLYRPLPFQGCISSPASNVVQSAPENESVDNGRAERSAEPLGYGEEDAMDIGP